MAFDETLAARIRQALARRKNIEEKMFGGIGFLLNGNLLVGVWKDSLIVRLGDEQHWYDDAVKDFMGENQKMRGFPSSTEVRE